ncbi:hypothetical protein HaLaN_11711 [Haematococcus lacustris]|uniref:Uncharacterized protein n=1 Tax=Haematococcus lacustris TaxID=44745 RepID=A0A699Z1T2_HAELA|nr:hypothetical protein HaLaN_11711 [Haematococcus lacustris]
MRSATHVISQHHSQHPEANPEVRVWVGEGTLSLYGAKPEVGRCVHWDHKAKSKAPSNSALCMPPTPDPSSRVQGDGSSSRQLRPLVEGLHDKQNSLNKEQHVVASSVAPLMTANPTSMAHSVGRPHDHWAPHQN